MVVAACDSSVRIDVRPYVTGAALSSLDSRGLFETEQAAAEPFDQITPETARAQAVVAARMFGPGLRSYLESGHGAAIDLNSLRATRVYYGTSAYDQTIPSDFRLGMRKLLGPYYFVVLSADDEPAVSVAVSPLAAPEAAFVSILQGNCHILTRLSSAFAGSLKIASSDMASLVLSVLLLNNIRFLSLFKLRLC